MTDIYQKWRESEAYAVPMTEDGVKWSQERWRGFNAGYKQAMKDVVDLLMIQHEAARGSHNYWHVAANLVRAEFLQDSDTSEKCVQKSEEIRREWVGLTDEEIDELYGSPMELEHSGALKWVRVIEAKLKEKNT